MGSGSHPAPLGAAPTALGALTACRRHIFRQQRTAAVSDGVAASTSLADASVRRRGTSATADNLANLRIAVSTLVSLHVLTPLQLRVWFDGDSFSNAQMRGSGRFVRPRGPVEQEL